MPFPLPAPMRRALALAAEASAAGEVPVGAVVTKGSRILAEARNSMRGTLDPTAHAEIVAIRAAAEALGSPRLDGCTLWVTLEPCAMCAAAEKLGSPRLDECALWVTLEPCAMCAAAIAIARIAELRFAAEDPKGGAVVHGPRIFAQPTCLHRPDVLGGIGEQQSVAMLRSFFEQRRS